MAGNVHSEKFLPLNWRTVSTRQGSPARSRLNNECVGAFSHHLKVVASNSSPASAPEFQITHPESRKITLPFHESGAGGGALSRGKPAGVQSTEFWVKVGAPAPATDADMAFLKSFERSPGSVDFKLEDIGKPIWVSARWLNTRGQPGVFSPIQNTVIS